MNHGVIALVHDIAQQIKPVYKDPISPEQTAWWMLQAITKKTRTTLLTLDTIQLSDQEQKKLHLWIKRHRDEEVPLQYLIGWVPFVNLELQVESPVLIPRPETEEWAYHLISLLKKLNNQKFTILEIGTGTGCIGLSLAKAFPEAMIYAADISDEALLLTEKNKVHNNIKNMRLIKSDIYDQIPRNLQCDLIVSNPPYIAPNEWNDLDPMVTKWEDRQALVAQEEGFAVIRNIIAHAHLFIKDNKEMRDLNIPQVIIEIGYKQGEEVQHLMERANYKSVSIWKDLEGKDRVVVGRIT